MKPKSMLLGLTMAAIGAHAASAQDGTAAPAAPAAAAPPPASAAGWVPVSRSLQKVYLIDPSKTRDVDGAKAVPVARTTVGRAAPDYSHGVDEIEVRCDANQSRATVSIEYGPDAAETDRYEDPSPWDAIQPNTIDAYVKVIVCDGARVNADSWPSIQAFIDAGQP